MPPRYTLPHIDISAHADAQEYSGHSSFDGGAVRIRAEHGRRLQNELTAALNASQEARPADQRLEQPPGSLIEVSLRRGTDPEKLNMKTEGVRAGAAKTTAANDRVIALYVPDDARIALEAILSDYLEKDTDGGNPRYKDRVEAIEAFRIARIETLWTDPRSIPEDPRRRRGGLCGVTATKKSVLMMCARVWVFAPRPTIAVFISMRSRSFRF